MTAHPWLRDATLSAARTLGKTVWAFFIAFVISISASSASLAQQRLEGVGVTILHDDGLQGAAERLLAAYGTSLERVKGRLELPHEEPVLIRIVRDDRRFAEVVRLHGGVPPAGSVAALAFPYQDVMVFKTDAWIGTGARMEELLLHELAHLVMGRLERTNAGCVIPLWFNEGVAQWVAESAFVGESDIVERAFARSEFLSFEDMAGAFRGSEEGTALAYAQSLSMVRFISRYGAENETARRNIPALLWLLGQGRTLEEAVPLVTRGVPLSDIDELWRGEVSRSWSLRLKSLPEFFWSGTVLVTITLAFAVMRTRRARRFREWEAEETATDESGASQSSNDIHGAAEAPIRD